MRNVLADLAVEAEAATIVAMRMAGATDRAARGDGREALLRRIGLAASKYWVYKRATPHAAEAMECFGGNGYAEDSDMPRLYREAPRWASGRAQATSVRSTLCGRWPLGPECVEVFFDELSATSGHDSRLDAHVANLSESLADLQTIEYRGRKVAEDISLALQARCSFGTVIQRWRRRSWLPGWRGIGAVPSARCPLVLIFLRSSSVLWSRDDRRSGRR